MSEASVYTSWDAFNEMQNTERSQQEKDVGDQVQASEKENNEATSSMQPLTPTKKRIAQSGLSVSTGSMQEVRGGEKPSGIPTGSTSKLHSMSKSPDFKKLAQPVQVYDFPRFLEKMRHKSSLPIVRHVKSFLIEFGRRDMTVSEQTLMIHTFLDMMNESFAHHPLWNYNEEELDSAYEGIEKLIMNKDSAPSLPKPLMTPRKMSKKLIIFNWVKPEHLDIPSTEGLQDLLSQTKNEIGKINDFRAPRDKLNCIMNASKSIYEYLKTYCISESKGADDFFPLLVLALLHGAPPRLWSNIQFIQRYRSPLKLQSENGYYLTNFMGALQFIEGIDATSLSVTTEEFEREIANRMAQLDQQMLNYHNDKADPQHNLYLPTSKDVKNTLNDFANKASKQLSILGKVLTEVGEELRNSKSLKNTPPPTPPRPGREQQIYPGQTQPAQSRQGFEGRLSVEERSLLDDYEMQLAMALSLSLEEDERIKSSTVPEELHSGKEPPKEEDLIKLEEEKPTM